MTVKVYGRPGCVQCKFTLKELDRHGILYEYRHVDECPDTAGIKQLPIVAPPGQLPWGGLRPDKIKELAETPKEMIA